ncbi:MAG TPA: cysteine desulfurase family protein [Polyangiaceae bacterium]
MSLAPLERAPIYLDWNATTPPSPGVLAAMREASAAWGNPASVHAVGRAARAVVETTREQLAAALSVHPRDVVFTSGGTEANNLALHAASQLVTSRLEHPSVVKVAEAGELLGKTHWLPVRSDGRIVPADLAVVLRELAAETVPRNVWVSVAAVNHETGVIQPVAELAEVVHGFGGRLHVDAVQALGKLDLAYLAGADALTVCAHKIRGPKGIGALAWRRGSTPEPLARGGAQERGFRPGSQDAMLAAGFGAALAGIDLARHARLAPLRDRLEQWLLRYGRVNGAVDARVSHVSNVSIDGWRSDELVAALDLRGLCVSAGSACSAGTIEPSPVISSMLDPERAARAVRISLGVDTTPQDIETALWVLEAVLGPPRLE